jgi:hypothetical protein
MKIFFCLFILCIPFIGAASEKIVLSSYAAKNFDHDLMINHFGFATYSNGKACVTYDLVTQESGRKIQLEVNGLSYDAGSKSVIYSSGSNVTTCSLGRVISKRRNILLFTNTEKCKLYTEIKNQDGEEYMQVIFEIL